LIYQHVFPSDLNNNPEYGQKVIFYAFKSEVPTWISSPTNQLVQSVTGGEVFNTKREIEDIFEIYIPGGGQESIMTWAQKHEYDEVKLSRLGATAVGLGAETGASGLVGAVARSAFRGVINPAVEVLYRSTNLRTFTFSFVFAPESRADADQLFGPISSDRTSTIGLLDRFRYHAAPQVTGPFGAFFKSPSEWEIEFRYRNSNGQWVKNANLPYIAKGVLGRVDVDYNPMSEFSTFEDGRPVTARLSMSFLETEIIDKNKIKTGY
jgi:hypothetical protein